MRKSASLNIQSSKPIVGYDNVSYEESFSIPDEYGLVYFIPVEGVHFRKYLSVTSSVGIEIIQSDIEMYNFMLHPGWNLAVGWYNYTIRPFPSNGFGNPNVNFAFTPGNDGYPFGNNWGRYYGIVNPAHLDWASVGNLGYKTIAEYNDLLSQMDNTTKRNLTGTRLY